MRRGHPNKFGWRNDGPRQFRPRGGGPPNFRPPRHFLQPFNEPTRFPPRQSLLGMPPFQPPCPPPPMMDFPPDRRPPPAPSERRPDQYRQINRLIEHRNNNYNYSRHDPEHYDSRNRDGYHINNHGDVDQRSLFGDVDQRNIGDVDQRPYNSRQDYQRPPPAWPDDERNRDYDRSRMPRYEEHNDYNKKLPQDYTGHRPPASDHYDRPAPPATDESFSRSVDDTVDIIRRKLMNRNDPQNQVTEAESQNESCSSKQSERFQENSQQENTSRKKSHKSKHTMKTNCDKIKNKIVHQLFKMDKERIHKLMDNPNSSSKFEYAINSLITESQNSMNRHLRSAAEKSLSGPRNDAPYQEDTDAIYEDTFMKQMQCILDPQDTVILEDIKPFVLAELNKVLGLDIHHRYDEPRDEEYGGSSRDYPYDSYQEYPESSHDQTELFPAPPQVSYFKSEFTEYEPIQSPERSQSPARSQSPERSQSSADLDSRNSRQEEREIALFERRKARQSCDFGQKTPPPRFPSFSPERSRKDNNLPAEPISPEPFFDPNADPMSEEEIFEELDRQYHVAVDRNFIGHDYTRSPSPSPSPMRPEKPATPIPRPERCKTPRSASNNKTMKAVTVKREPNVRDITKPTRKPTIVPIAEIKQEAILNALHNHLKDDAPGSADSTITPTDESTLSSVSTEDAKKEERVLIKKERGDDTRSSREEIQKPDSSTSSEVKDKSTASSHSRKRSSDQKPSHRKEKRKKSDTSPSDKQILNKNIIINVNDCPSKSENCDTNNQSVFNLYFSKDDDDASKEAKKKEGTESEYSDKYVKRKETPKTPKDKNKSSEPKKRTNSTSSNHSTISPKESSNSSHSQTPSKTDAKTKYQPIDMFSEMPRRPNVVQPPRVTAVIVPKSTSSLLAPQHKNKKPEPVKTYPKQTPNKNAPARTFKKGRDKETQTNQTSSSTSRFVQTIRKKTITRGAQTDPVSISIQNKTTKSSEPFSRMKEIDMEIQALLQEKFKLYNSLENKNAGQPSSMQNLGMAVLSVANNPAPISPNEDTIIDEFTSIPAEELEQIAMESADCNAMTKGKGKKSRKQRLQEEHRKRSESPGTKRKKGRPPNISLLEQIIDDDRPLDDIICLDDLETSPLKTKGKKSKKDSKKANKARSLERSPIVYPEVKPCSVVLWREDLTKKMRPKNPKEESKDPDSDHSYSFKDNPTEEKVEEESKILDFDKEIVDVIVKTVVEAVRETSVPETMLIEEPVNEFHFDMLEVSEDIVIGECDKIEKDTVSVPVSEEIVLDNSQSGEDTPSTAEAQPAPSECKMYDYSADEDLKHDSVSVTGHADAVLAMEFVDNNNFLAACLDGSVYHFSSDGQLLTTLRGSNLAVTCLTIVKEKYGTTVYTGSLDSRIRYFDLDTGLEKGPECNVLSPIQTMDRAWDTVFVGTRTGFVLQFECRNNMLIPISSIKFSDQSILALRALKEGPRKVLLVASRSESVTIKDAQTGLLLRTLDGPKMTVYTLLYEDGKVFCGTSSNMIQVFDYASGLHMGGQAGGKGCVCLRGVGGVLFAGCYDGCVYVFRAQQERPAAMLRGPSVMLLSLAVHGTKIIAGYKDRSLYIWKIPDNILQEMIL